MCDDFETAEEMPLETEVRHILEERRSSRAAEWAEHHEERRHSQGDHIFVEDFAGNITAKPPEAVIKQD